MTAPDPSPVASAGEDQGPDGGWEAVVAQRLAVVDYLVRDLYVRTMRHLGRGQAADVLAASAAVTVSDPVAVAEALTDAQAAFPLDSFDGAEMAARTATLFIVDALGCARRHDDGQGFTSAVQVSVSVVASTGLKLDPVAVLLADAADPVGALAVGRLIMAAT